MLKGMGAAMIASLMLTGTVNAETSAPKNTGAPKTQIVAKPARGTKQPERPSSVESGVASIYCFRNGPTASGERSRPALLTAAHKTLPFGTQVEVTNRQNGRTVVVRINDRGPFIAGRVIDVTPAAARVLKFDGVAPVTLRVLDNRRDLRLVARAT
jgi:rare lipoprotein A